MLHISVGILLWRITIYLFPVESHSVVRVTTPFAIDYKGWKPNILGKFFASDSTVPVPTWKKSLGIIGDELIKMAGSIAALKVFEAAIKETELKERLDKAVTKLKEEQQLDRSSNASTILGNEGYNHNISGTSVANDITRFARK